MPSSSRKKEVIDERILRLIGLEDVFDLDYDTYRSLLKEVLIKVSLGKLRIPDEERDLLREELKKYHGGGKQGRFNIKKKKISASSFSSATSLIKVSQKKLKGSSFSSIVKDNKFTIKKDSEVGDSLKKDVASLRASVESIYGSISLQQAALANQLEVDRKEQENEKRSGRESDLEKRFSVVRKVIDKLLAPVKNILSSILDFFIKMILGRALMKLIDWFANPANKGKIDAIFSFLKTFWPALLAAYVLFGTRLGNFAGTLIASVGKFLIRLTRFAIPGLLRFIARHPLGFAAAALFGAGAAAELVPGMTGGETKKASGTNDEKNAALGFAGGGYGLVRGKKGVDQINARLSDGEFIMSPGAVKMWGVDTLEKMNAAGGGTNKPKIYGGIKHAAGGGYLGKNIGGFPEATNKNDRYLSDITNLKKFIREKLGYNIDKPETWGKAFQSGVGFGSRSPGSSSVNPLENIRRQVNDYALSLKSGRPSSTPTSTRPSGPNPIASALGRFLGNVANNPYMGETAAIERERSLGLMKPGADPLTKETKERLTRNDDWIKSLYDPTKHKGIEGSIRKRFQDIQDKGLFADPLAFLKTEGFEKGVEKLSRGRVKNFGASVQGVQMSLKALAGPLGRMFRVEDQGAMGRYLRPAMMEAQKRGHGDVGAAALGQELYNKLLPNKLANFALGQTAFKVDSSGRAMTGVTGTSRDETWDFNKTAEKNFGDSRKALKALSDVLQGRKAKIGEGKNAKDATIGNAAFETLFKGMSGVYRMLQNTAYGNLRPMGSNIDLGGGFKPTDAKGRVISSQQAKTAAVTERYGQGVTLYDKPRTNTGQSYQSRFARPQNAGVAAVKPPVRSGPVTMYAPNDPRRTQAGPYQSRFARRTTLRGRTGTTHPSGHNNTKKIFGIF